MGASYVQRFRVAYTVNTFCADLADQSYNAAYGLLSQRARQTMSESRLADDVRGGHLTSCTISQGTMMYGNIVISGNLATVTVTYVYSDASDASGATAAGGVMALVNENGGWRVDSFDWVNPFPALIQ